MSWQRHSNGEIRDPSEREPENLKKGIHALIVRSGVDEQFSVHKRSEWVKLFQQRLANPEETLQDWLDLQDPRARFLFEVGISQSQGNRDNPNFGDLHEAEIEILDERSWDIEPPDEFLEPTKTTHFGPRTTLLLARNRHHHARNCSLQDLYLIAISVRCLREKSLKLSEWLTNKERLTLAESRLHPEVRFLIDQEDTRERLLLCTELERTPFLNWVTDVNRLTRPQLESLLTKEAFKDFSENLTETRAAVICYKSGCVHELPSGVSVFKANIVLPSRVARTVERANDYRSFPRVTFLALENSSAPPSNQTIIVEKLYLLYFIWKRLSWDECVSAARFPVTEDSATGLPSDFFALWPTIRTWSNHASAGGEGSYWLSGFNLNPKPPAVVELPRLGLNYGGTTELPPVFHRYLGGCRIIVGHLQYKPGIRRHIRKLSGNRFWILWLE